MGNSRHVTGAWAGRLFVAFLTLLVGSSRELAGSPAEAPRQQELRILRVGYIPIAECAQLYVGLSRKYFLEEGLDVQLQPMTGGQMILPAVEKGDLDIGFTNVISLILSNTTKAAGAPTSFLALVGGTYERPGFSNHALLVRHGEFTQPSDLARRSVRIALNTTRNIEELMLRRYLGVRKIPEKGIEIRQIPFPQMLSALDMKDVDVAAVVEPFIEPALRTKKYDLLDHHYLKVAPETAVATYAVSRAWHGKNATAAAAFTRAFRKASAFLHGQPEEARRIIGQYTRIRREDLEIMGLPAFDPEVSRDSLTPLIDSCVQFGLLKQRPDIAAIFSK